MIKIVRRLLLIVIFGVGLSACSMDMEAFHRGTREPNEAVRGQLYGAIHSDLEFEHLLNGGWVRVLLGSGNLDDLGIHIRDMRCRSSAAHRLCAFDLIRDSDVKRVSDANEPRLLHCTARFSYSDGGWKVDRLFPKRGHTRTTMACEIAETETSGSMSH